MILKSCVIPAGLKGVGNLKSDNADFLELSHEILDRGKLMRFRAHGRSMHPFIKNGNIISIEPLNGISARIGDIIFFHTAEGSPVVHRLINKKIHKDEVSLITRGESQKYFDLPIRLEQVIGKVTQIEDKNRRLQLKGWLGRVFIFLIVQSIRGKYPNQIRVTRNIGRLWWLFGGKKFK